MPILSNMKYRIFVIIFFSLSPIFFSSPAFAADTLACCIKTSKDTPPVITYEQATKQKCTVDIVNDYANTVWRENQDAGGNKCIDKPKPVTTREEGSPLEFTPGVTIPGDNSPYVAGQAVKLPESTKALADYIIAIFKYAIGVIGIIASIVLMFGGIRWLTAGGNADAISEAKTFIGGSLTGLILALGSFLLLSTINTSLVNFNIHAVKKIQNMDLGEPGCCKKANNTYETTTTDQCNEQVQGQKVEFFAGQVAMGDRCEVPKGCCQVSFRVEGSNLRAFDVKNESECKYGTLSISLPGGGIASAVILKFEFKRDWYAQKDLIAPNPVICGEKKP